MLFRSTEETHDEPRFEVRGEEHGEELNVRRVDAEGDESLKEQPASEETLLPRLGWDVDFDCGGCQLADEIQPQQKAERTEVKHVGPHSRSSHERRHENVQLSGRVREREDDGGCLDERVLVSSSCRPFSNSKHALGRRS